MNVAHVKICLQQMKYLNQEKENSYTSVWYNNGFPDMDILYVSECDLYNVRFLQLLHNWNN